MRTALVPNALIFLTPICGRRNLFLCWRSFTFTAVRRSRYWSQPKDWIHLFIYFVASESNCSIIIYQMHSTFTYSPPQRQILPPLQKMLLLLSPISVIRYTTSHFSLSTGCNFIIVEDASHLVTGE